MNEKEPAARPSRDSRAIARIGESGAWCRRDSGGSQSRPRRSRQASAGLRHPPIDLHHRLRDLSFPAFVRGHSQLPFELRARKPQRFERADELRIANRPPLPRRSLALDFLEAFLNARLRIDQSLTCIT